MLSGEYWWDAWEKTLTEFQAHQQNRLKKRNVTMKRGEATPSIQESNNHTRKMPLGPITTQVNRMKQINA